MDAPAEPSIAGVWASLGERVGAANYRPAADPAVTVRCLVEDGETYYVLRQGSHYLRLDARDYALWQQMDGARTVKDLVVFYFAQFGAFAYARVAQLVENLKAGGFLLDRPAHTYESIRQALRARDPGYAGEKAARAFLSREFPFTNIDPYFTRLYRLIGRFLFNGATLAALGALAAAGFVAFAYLLTRAPAADSRGGSVLAGFVTFLLATVIILVIHEHAHALATKHFGRRVPTGGFMIYYGMPAFFVDLMDIWMEPKGARIAVTAAGPFSDVVLGGALSLLALAAGAHESAGALFVGALTAYLSAYANLNPLLELDGYLMLQDWLRMPKLRERAFAFLRTGLWRRLRDAAQDGAARGPAARLRARLRALTHEERVYTAYGVLALLYAAYSVALALFFWQNYLARLFDDLWQAAAAPGRLALLALAALAVGAALVLAALWVWRSLRALREWLAQRDFFADWRRVFAAIMAGAAAVWLAALAAPVDGRAFYLRWEPVALLLAAAAGFARAAGAYRGARFRRALAGLVAAMLVAALARVPGADLYGLPHLLAALALLPGAAAASSREDHALLRPRERRAAWLLPSAAFVLVAGLLGAGLGDPLTWGVAAATEAALFGFLLLIAPWVVGYWGTQYAAPWLTVAAATGCTALLVLSRFAPGLDLVAATLWAAAGVSVAIFSRRLTAVRHAFEAAPVLTEGERLREGFAHLTAVLFDSFRESFGRRAADALSDEMEVIGRDADWPVMIYQYRVRDSLSDAVSVAQRGDHYREALQTLAAQMVEVAGQPFVRRAMQASYDLLPWQEREALAHYVLAGTVWGGVVDERFAGARSERLSLLQRAPIFAGFDADGYAQVLAVLGEGKAQAGQTLAREGAPATRFYLVRLGEVGAYRRRPDGSEAMVAELRRGAHFGEAALAGRGVYDATYRANTYTEFLVIDGAKFDPLLRADTRLASQVRERLDLELMLWQMPLFAELSAQEISAVVARARRLRVEAGQVLARQGQPRSDLFILIDAVVEAWVADPDAEGGARLAGTYGAGEHFGEYALFADTPYPATYRVARPGLVLALDEATFDRLVAEHGRMAGYVQQVGSARRIGAR